MASIASLSFTGSANNQVTDLTGLESMTNLVVLDLPGNRLKDGALSVIKPRIAESGPMKGKSIGLSSLQVLNVRGSSLLLSDLTNIPLSIQSIAAASIINGRSSSGTDVPAPVDQTAGAFSRLPVLANLQLGTSTANLVIDETATTDGPSAIINSAAGTFQIVRNVAPKITLPANISAGSEGQTVTFAGLLGQPGVSISDRDVFTTSAVIIDSAGQRTTLTSQASSPSFEASDSVTKMTINLNDVARPQNATLEAFLRAGQNAVLPTGNMESISIVSFSSDSVGYRLEVTKIGLKTYWTAWVDGQRITKSVTEAEVIRNAWTHVAVTVENSQASLYVNGKLIGSVSIKRKSGGPAVATVGQSGFAIDELRLFNKARTAAEILATKDQALTASTPNLVGYWNFDDAPGWETKRIPSSKFAQPTEYVVLDDGPLLYNYKNPDAITAPVFSGNNAFEARAFQCSNCSFSGWVSNNSIKLAQPLTLSKGDILYFYAYVPANTLSGEASVSLEDAKTFVDAVGVTVNAAKVTARGQWIRYEQTIGYDAVVNYLRAFTNNLASTSIYIDKIGIVSKNVQPGVVANNNIAEHKFSIRDLSSNKLGGTVVESTSELLKPKTRFDVQRPTVAVNNSFTLKDDGIYALEVTAVDIDGASTTRTTKLTVTNLSPTTDIAGLPSGAILAGTEVALSQVASGAAVAGKPTLDPSTSDASQLRTEWKVSSNTGQVIATSSGTSFKFVPSAAGSYVITKTTVDPQGAADVDTATVQVNPRVIFEPKTIVAKEGSRVAIDLRANSSPASDRATRTYSWIVKQGTTDITSGTGNVISFVPADNVAYTVSATISDTFEVPVGPAQSFSSTSRLDFTPTDVAPEITLVGIDPAGMSAPVGNFSLIGQAASRNSMTGPALPTGTVQPGQLAFIVSDAGSLDRHTVSISWGDGQSDHNVDTLSIAPHKFDKPGTYTVKLTVNDTKNNARSETSFALLVTPVAPIVSVPTPAPINDGQVITLVPTIVYAGAKSENEKVTWEIVSPTGNAMTLIGREPKFTPDRSGTWGAVAIVEDGFGNLVRASGSFTVNNQTPLGLTATEDAVDSDSLLRTYTGSVRDFSADRLQGKLIVQNDSAGTRVETPVSLVKQGVPDAGDLQSYTFSASLVLGQATGNIVSVEVVDQDGAIATAAVTRVSASTEDYSNAIGYPEARHTALGPQLGEKRTTESALPTGSGVVSTGDEDGVTFSGLQPGATGSMTVDVRNVPAGGAQLDAWIDFNGNSLFDADEKVLSQKAVNVSGSVTFDVAVPLAAKSGDVTARIRVSQPTDGAIGPGGLTASGEVEDYAISIGSLTFDRDTNGNLTVTSLSDRADVVSVSSDGTILIFTLDKISDVTLTAAFTSAGGSLDSANKQVKIPLTQATGETTLKTAAGTDAITVQLGNNLPKIFVDNTSLDLANTLDTLTYTSTAALSQSTIQYSATDTGSITATAAGALQPIRFGGPMTIKSQADVANLSIMANSLNNSVKLRTADAAGSFNMFAQDQLAVSFKQPTASLTIQAAGFDLLSGFAAPIQTTFDAGSEGSVRLSGLVDTTGISISGLINLEDNTTLDSKGTVADGAIAINGLVDGAFALTLNSGTGVSTVLGDIGRATPLTSFVSDATGSLRLNGAINAANIAIADPLTLTGNVLLAGEKLTVSEVVTLDSALDRSLDVRVTGTGDFAKAINETGGGKLAFIHSGSGITTLHGVNTYSGNTSIDLGELRLDVGAIIAGDATVGAGGKLGGKGEVKGKTTQAPGSNINPGASPGILTISNNTEFADEANLKLEFNGLAPGSQHDQILVTGAGHSIQLARVNLQVSVGYTPMIGDQFTVVRVADTSSTRLGTFDDADGKEIVEGGTFTAGGYRFQVTYAANADLDGANNDVVFTIVDYARDYGSAPDSYGTTNASDGPRHRLGSGLGLGANLDADQDADALESNDGVTFGELRVGDDAAQLEVFVVTTRDQVASLDAWIDFDADGTFDNDEQIFSREYVTGGLNSLVFTISDSALTGATYARFRLTSNGIFSPTGEAADGEVEDYAVTLLSDRDVGGAPGYGVAEHIVGGPQLGQLVDREASLTGSDDDNNLSDNDGVWFGEVQTSGGAFVRVDATNVGSGARLNGWIDFNRNGSFSDAGEYLFQNIAVVDGRNLLEFELPAGVTAGDTYARFRISTAGGLPAVDADLPAADGEVEDHALTIVPKRFSVAGATAVTLVGNDLLVTDLDNSNDQLTISSDGHYISISDPNKIFESDLALAHGSGTHTVRIPIVEIAVSMLINTFDGDDQLVLDYADGSLLSMVQFDGGSGNDKLSLSNGALAGITIKRLTADASELSFGDSELIKYQAESLISTLDIDDVTVIYGDGDDAVDVMHSAGKISLSGDIQLAIPERLSIFTGDGDDRIRLDDNGQVAGGSIDFINFDLIVDAGGQPDDQLEIVDSSDSTSDSFIIGGDAIVANGASSLFGAGGSLSFAGIAGLSIEPGTADNQVTIEADDLVAELQLHFAAGSHNSVNVNSDLAWDSLAIDQSSLSTVALTLASADINLPEIVLSNVDRLNLSAIASLDTAVTYEEPIEDLKIQDAGTVNVTRLTHNLAGTSEVLISNPTDLLTIATGDIQSHKINVESFGSGMAASLTLESTTAADEIKWKVPATTELVGLLLRAKTITLDASAITTVNEQVFDGQVQLATDVTLTATRVEFAGGVDAQANQSLTVVTQALQSLQSIDVGALTVNGLLADDAVTPSASLAGNVSTVGGMLFSVPIVLEQNVTLSGSTIDIGQVDFVGQVVGRVSRPVQDAAALTLVGPATLRGAIGSEEPLSGFNANSLKILGNSITTTGLQNYNGPVTLDGDLVINGPAQITMAMTGVGGLILTGDVTLHADNIYQGDTTVLGGELILLGSIASDLTVFDATLSGTGTVHGDVVIGAGGLLAPTPDATKWLTIDGNLSFDNDGGFVLAAVDSATVGRIQTKHIELNDAWMFDSLDFAPLLGDRLVFLSATAGLTGEFHDVDDQSFVSLNDTDVLADYVLTLASQQFVITGYGDGDYGDAPTDSFKSDFGAAHRAVGPTLGATRQADEDGFITEQIDDGVTFVGELTASATISTTGGVIVTASGAAKLDAWIDFNQDGDWDDAGEQIFASRIVQAGSNRLAFTFPAGALAGESYARFRLSTAGGLAPTGIALDGEVEDYLVTLDGATVADTFTLHIDDQPTSVRLESGSIVTRVNGQIVSSVPSQSVTVLIIEGDERSNHLTIDAAAIPVGGLSYHGNGDGDSDDLSVINGAGQVLTVNHNFANAHDGSVVIDGKQINYTGLEPILDSVVAGTRSFVFGGEDDQVTLGDNAVSGDNISRITSVQSSESVEFVNPASGMTIDLGEGNNQLTVGAMDSGATAPMIVRFGSGADQLRAATGDLDLSGKTLVKNDGLLTISSRVAGSSFGTSGNGAVQLASGGQFTNQVTLSNTGGVWLGQKSSDIFFFDRGLTYTSGTTTVLGTVRATNNPLTFGDVVLAGDTTLTGSVITLDSISGTGNLNLNGTVRLKGAINLNGILNINGALILDDDAELAFVGTTIVTTSIGGSFNLIKSSSGTLRLINSGFSGQLVISDGTVELATGSQGPVLLDGGTMQSSGLLVGGLFAASGGTVRLGSTTTILSVAGDVVLNAATDIAFDINGAFAGSDYDQLLVMGAGRAVNLDNASLKLNAGFNPVVGSKFTLLSLADSSSTLTGQFADLPEGALIQAGSAAFTISYVGGDGNDVVLTAVATSQMDAGDAPESYGTLVSDDGARHLATGPMLGTIRDSESDGTPSVDADGDNLAVIEAGTVSDEDGVTQVGASAVGLQLLTSVANTLNVHVSNSIGGTELLSIWIDWDGDGVFQGNDFVQQQPVVEGDNAVQIFVLPGAQIGSTYARFRVSSTSMASPTGLMPDGEVEDYLVTIVDSNELPSIAAQPALTMVEDADQTDFKLSGISSGDAGQLMALEAVSLNSELFTVAGITYGRNESEAILSLVPVRNAYGTGSVTVTLRDPGLDNMLNTEDDVLTTSTIQVNVTSANDSPTVFAETLSLLVDENAGPQSVLLFGISDGDRDTQSLTLSVSSDTPALFKNLAIVRDNEDPSQAELKFESGLNRFGNAKIFVTVDDGLTTTTQTISLEIHQRNDPPTLDSIAPIFLNGATTSQSISLTGIGAGPGESQVLEVYALISEQPEMGALTSATVVNYQSTASTATLNLTFNPAQRGSDTIFVVVRDAGDDGLFGTSDDAITSQSVLVTLNAVPSLDAIRNISVLPSAGEQTIALAGINDGDASNQRLRITATSGSTSVLDNPTVVYDAANRATTGQLKFTPLALGSSVISVTVTDAGWDDLFDTEDDRQSTRQFTVNVTETVNSWNNSTMPLDVNGDGLVLPIDVLLVVNELNSRGTGTLPERTTAEPPFIDVNNDGLLQPLDALLIINEINSRAAAEGELLVHELPMQLARVKSVIMQSIDALHAEESGEFDEVVDELVERATDSSSACPLDVFYKDHERDSRWFWE